jgi:hypothetical protein
MYLNDILADLRNGSSLLAAGQWLLGAIAGSAHHLGCQYPKQAQLDQIGWVVLGQNIVNLIALYAPGLGFPSTLEFIYAIFTFNLAYALSIHCAIRLRSVDCDRNDI